LTCARNSRRYHNPEKSQSQRKRLEDFRGGREVKGGKKISRSERKSVAERVTAMEEIYDKGRLTWHVNLLSDSTQEPEVSFKRHAAHPLHLTSY
jgi:hypothetical protein